LKLSTLYSGPGNALGCTGAICGLGRKFRSTGRSIDTDKTMTNSILMTEEAYRRRLVFCHLRDLANDAGKRLYGSHGCQ
jgi:hypothetical protein